MMTLSHLENCAVSLEEKMMVRLCQFCYTSVRNTIATA